MRQKSKKLKITISLLGSLVILAGTAVALSYYFYWKPKPKNTVLIAQNELTVGSWNTLNFINASGQTQISNGKIDAVANIINYLQYDIVGLLEINQQKTINEVQINYFMDALNNQTDKSWNYISSANLPRSPNTAPGQVEQVLVLYNANIVTPIATHVYSNAETNKLYYVRPPFGVAFSLKGTTPMLATVFDHFDSPGTTSKVTTTFNPETDETKSAISKQGSYEAHDAWYLTQVLEEMQTTLKTQNLMFMGDTNIYLHNQAQAFNETALADRRFSFAFSDTLAAATSLSRTAGQYANPYDKIIYHLEPEAFTNMPINNTLTAQMKEIDSVSNAFIYDLWTTLDYKVATKPTTSSKSDSDYIRTTISDHAPIGVKIAPLKN